MLDAPLHPENKIQIAPELFAGLDTDDPRRARSRSRTREGLDGDQAAELDSLGERLDDVVTGACSAFRTTFIVTAGLALVAALVLLWGALAPAGAVGRPAIAAAAVAALLAAAVCRVAFADSRARDGGDRRSLRGPRPPRRRRDHRRDPADLARRLDRGGVRHRLRPRGLLLALFDDRLQEEFEEEHGVNPRSPAVLGPALLGL